MKKPFYVTVQGFDYYDNPTSSPYPTKYFNTKEEAEKFAKQQNFWNGKEQATVYYGKWDKELQDYMKTSKERYYNKYQVVERKK